MEINRVADKIEFNLSDEEKSRESKWSDFQFDLALDRVASFDSEKKMWIADAGNERLIMEIYHRHYPETTWNQLDLF